MAHPLRCLWAKLIFLTVLNGFCSSVASALLIEGYNAETHDRFVNDPAFLLADYDLSAVGRSSDGRWGTLISENVFITARHLRPANGETLTFHATNDPAGLTVTRVITGGQRIGASDLWVGVLDSPVTASIAPLPYLTFALPDANAFGASPLWGALGILVGRSPGNYPSLTDVAVGLNVLDLAADSISVAGSTDFALIADDDGANGVPSEAYLQGGDSGAPLLVTTAGPDSVLLLAGINWFNGTAEINNVEVPISGFSYLGNYEAEIGAYIALHAVPEAGTVGGLIGLCVLGAAIRRRRLRRAA